MTIRTNIPNKKKNSEIEITCITNQEFRKLLKQFNNLPYLGYKSKQDHNETTEDQLLLINLIYKLIKINKHIQIRTKGVKLDADRTKFINETIRNTNRTIQSRITLMHGKKLERVNIMIMYDKEANKHKDTSREYDNKGKKNISIIRQQAIKHN